MVPFVPCHTFSFSVHMMEITVMTAKACLAVVVPGQRVGKDLADAFGTGLVCFSVLQHLPQSDLLQNKLWLCT